MTDAYPSQHVFVGRQRELEALVHGFETARAGNGSLWLLVGEAGIGKTRVADELTIEARRRGATVLWARCWEGEGAPAFWPWVELIRAYVRDCEGPGLAADMGAGAASIAQVAPDVRRLLPDLPEPPDLGPADARFRFFDAVASFLRNAARRQPLVLVLDDLHWADTPSLLLLRFVARETRATPLLIIGTARDAELPADHPAARTLGQVAREGQQLELRGLSELDLARFIELLQGAKPAAQLVAAVHRRTDGNPFFAGELVRLLTAEGEAGMAAGGAAIPISVRQTIHNRLIRLPPGCVRILQIAAVIGAEFDMAVIEGVAALQEEPIADRARLLAGLDECVRARLVAPRPRLPGRYRFTHALVRETLCDELGSAARAQHHRRVGEVLERLHADDPEPHLAELAHHFFEAAPVDETDRALAYAIRAAERSTRRLAYEDAAERYQAALQLMALRAPAAALPSPAGGPPDAARQRCELLIALGEARARAGETAAAREAFVSAAELARGLGMVELLTDAALGLAGGADVTSRVDSAAMTLLEAALAASGTTDSPARARLLSRLATGLYFSDAAERRATLSRQAVEIAERLGDPVTLALVLHNAHFAVLGPDSLDERTLMASRIIALGETSGRKDLTFAGHYWRLVDALERGDIAVVDASQRAHAELAEELGQPFHRWRVRVLAAMRAVLSGRLADAERLIEEALQLGQRATPNALLVYGVQLYGLRREQGRLDEIEPAIRALAEEHSAMPAFHSGLALLCCHLGRLAEARITFDELAAQHFDQFPRDANWLNAMDELAQVCAVLGDRERAAMIYERLAPYERHNVVIGFAEGCEGSVARYLGVLAATVARWDEAARHFDAALAMNTALGAWPQLAHTQRDYAALLHARGAPGDQARAAALQAAAHAAFVGLGMSSFAEQLAVGAVAESALPPTAAQAPELAANQLRRQGEYWTVGFGGTVVRLKDAKGVRYLAELLRQPGREMHVADLVAAVDGTAADASRRLARAQLAQEGLSPDAGSDGPVNLDAQARASYRRRLRDLHETLDEAERFNDAPRIAGARAEIEFLTGELAAAYGLHGARSQMQPLERMRKAVGNRIRAAIERLRPLHPGLARHLSIAVKLGAFCSYRPDPPVAWDVA